MDECFMHPSGIYELEGIVSSSENVEQLMGNEDCDEECTRLVELSNQIISIEVREGLRKMRV